jgi:rubredoxin
MYTKFLQKCGRLTCVFSIFLIAATPKANASPADLDAWDEWSRRAQILIYRNAKEASHAPEEPHSLVNGRHKCRKCGNPYDPSIGLVDHWNHNHNNWGTSPVNWACSKNLGDSHTNLIASLGVMPKAAANVLYSLLFQDTYPISRDWASKPVWPPTHLGQLALAIDSLDDSRNRIETWEPSQQCIQPQPAITVNAPVRPQLTTPQPKPETRNKNMAAVDEFKRFVYAARMAARAFENNSNNLHYGRLDMFGRVDPCNYCRKSPLQLTFTGGGNICPARTNGVLPASDTSELRRMQNNWSTVTQRVCGNNTINTYTDVLRLLDQEQTIIRRLEDL